MLRKKVIDSWLCLLSICLPISSCSTTKEILEIEKSKLVKIDRETKIIAIRSENGKFDKDRYDLHFFIGADVFKSALKEFQGSSFPLMVNRREVLITVKKVTPDFKDGACIAKLDIEAFQSDLDLTAKIIIDATFVLQTNKNDEVQLSLHGTNAYPQLKRGEYDLLRLNFLRGLARLEVEKYTEKIPTVSVPLKEDFGFAIPERNQSITENIEKGSISGIVKSPPVRFSGTAQVRESVVLKDGVHLFANIEKIKIQ